MSAFDVTFWVAYLTVGLPLTVLLDRAIDVRGEWIWQTCYRLRQEHKRLYPKGK